MQFRQIFYTCISFFHFPGPVLKASTEVSVNYIEIKPVIAPSSEDVQPSSSPAGSPPTPRTSPFRPWENPAAESKPCVTTSPPVAPCSPVLPAHSLAGSPPLPAAASPCSPLLPAPSAACSPPLPTASLRQQLQQALLAPQMPDPQQTALQLQSLLVQHADILQDLLLLQCAQPGSKAVQQVSTRIWLWFSQQNVVGSFYKGTVFYPIDCIFSKIPPFHNFQCTSICEI